MEQTTRGGIKRNSNNQQYLNHSKIIQEIKSHYSHHSHHSHYSNHPSYHLHIIQKFKSKNSKIQVNQIILKKFEIQIIQEIQIEVKSNHSRKLNQSTFKSINTYTHFRNSHQINPFKKKSTHFNHHSKFKSKSNHFKEIESRNSNKNQRIQQFQMKMIILFSDILLQVLCQNSEKEQQ
ncbi:hypothetical protein M0811_14415 [Anaeramoeba ignava]|uniref:Uncharacterized protein n=1 Tax=Anaeramoeba ignava TaxID=1746090 RepID=A0A9Q0LVU4_ANAIG|nr:hypothetical protein M0811_14415 [Anaeramoeba ignava]